MTMINNPKINCRLIFFPYSVVLLLNHCCLLKIESEFGKPIILYASPTPFIGSTISATLLDTGNFVLQDIQVKTVLWQIFDQPTDSSLPVMKLGMNHKTGFKLMKSNREKVHWKT